MSGTTNALRRRLRDPQFAARYFAGDAIDIGAGPDSLDLQRAHWPLLRSVRSWDKEDGDAQYLVDLEPRSFDLVYCVLPGRLVRTPRRWVPIETIRPGDVVLGRSGYVRVNATHRMPYRGNVVTLEAGECRTVVTANHPVATPFGWVDAHQLRPADQVLACASEIEPPNFVDRGDIGIGIAADRLAASDRSVAVSVLCPALAELDNDPRLASLSSQMRRETLEEVARGHVATMQGDGVAEFPVARSGPLSRVARPFDRLGRKDRLDARENIGVAIHDLRLRLNAPLADQQADAALAVHNAGEPCPVRLGDVHSSNITPYSGTVHNLDTEDGTFFVDGILTHNSSHCLEHLPYPRTTVERWWELVRPGGHLVVVVPDEDLYEQGVWPSTFNADHKHTFTVWKGIPSWSPVSVSVLFLTQLCVAGDIVKVERIEEGFDFSLPRHDQTARRNAESCIEFIVRKQGQA